MYLNSSQDTCEKNTSPPNTALTGYRSVVSLSSASLVRRNLYSSFPWKLNITAPMAAINSTGRRV